MAPLDLNGSTKTSNAFASIGRGAGVGGGGAGDMDIKNAATGLSNSIKLPTSSSSSSFNLQHHQNQKMFFNRADGSDADFGGKSAVNQQQGNQYVQYQQLPQVQPNVISSSTNTSLVAATAASFHHHQMPYANDGKIPETAVAFNAANQRLLQQQYNNNLINQHQLFHQQPSSSSASASNFHSNTASNYTPSSNPYPSSLPRRQSLSAGPHHPRSRGHSRNTSASEITDVIMGISGGGVVDGMTMQIGSSSGSVKRPTSHSRNNSGSNQREMMLQYAAVSSTARQQQQPQQLPGVMIPSSLPPPLSSNLEFVQPQLQSSSSQSDFTRRGSSAGSAPSNHFQYLKNGGLSHSGSFSYSGSAHANDNNIPSGGLNTNKQFQHISNSSSSTSSRTSTINPPSSSTSSPAVNIPRPSPHEFESTLSSLATIVVMRLWHQIPLQSLLAFSIQEHQNSASPLYNVTVGVSNNASGTSVNHEAAASSSANIQSGGVYSPSLANACYPSRNTNVGITDDDIISPKPMYPGSNDDVFAFRSFYRFCLHIQRRTKISPPVVILALLYVSRLRHIIAAKYPSSTPGSPPQMAPGSERVMWIVSLVLANKILDDDRFTNRSWAMVGKINLDELNRFEREALHLLKFKLYVGEVEYRAWLQELEKVLSGFLEGLSMSNQQQQEQEARRQEMMRQQPQQEQEEAAVMAAAAAAASYYQQQQQQQFLKRQHDIKMMEERRVEEMMRALVDERTRRRRMSDVWREHGSLVPDNIDYYNFNRANNNNVYVGGNDADVLSASTSRVQFSSSGSLLQSHLNPNQQHSQHHHNPHHAQTYPPPLLHISTEGAIVGNSSEIILTPPTANSIFPPNSNQQFLTNIHTPLLAMSSTMNNLYASGGGEYSLSSGNIAGLISASSSSVSPTRRMSAISSSSLALLPSSAASPINSPSSSNSGLHLAYASLPPSSKKTQSLPRKIRSSTITDHDHGGSFHSPSGFSASSSSGLSSLRFANTITGGSSSLPNESSIGNSLNGEFVFEDLPSSSLRGQSMLPQQEKQQQMSVMNMFPHYQQQPQQRPSRGLQSIPQENSIVGQELEDWNME